MERKLLDTNISRAKAAEMFLSGESEKICHALIALCYEDSDPAWVEKKAVSYLTHTSHRVQATAVHTIFLLSRLREYLDIGRAFEISRRYVVSSDAEIYEAADELLAEVVSIAGLEKELTLEEIHSALEKGTELEKLVGIRKLFRIEDSEEEIKRIARKQIVTGSDLVKGMFLGSVFGFQWIDDNTEDPSFGRELIALIKENASDYVMREIRLFEERASSR